MYSCKKDAIRIFAVYLIGVTAAVVFVVTPFSIPCLFKLVTGIPCPGCGLSRAFILLLRLQPLDAILMNILFLPLAVGAAAYFVVAVANIKTGINYVEKLNKKLANKYIITLAVILMVLSWVYNIARGI